MKATIIYNDGEFREPKIFEFPIDKFVPAPVFDLDERLDIIYRQCSHVDNTEWIAGQKLRSMSVGDMVKLNDNLFVCARSGWVKVG